MQPLVRFVPALLGIALLAPRAFPQTGAATLHTLYSFTGKGGDGELPYGGLTVGANAKLYGTTVFGGASGTGTVFELDPPAAPGGTWRESVLYSFGGGADGANPYGTMVFGSNGALYGTTATGGAANEGVVFELAPPADPGGVWTETILHDFGSPGDGANPFGGLIFGGNGKLYGTTFSGGVADSTCYGGQCGTVFALEPPTVAGGAWTETIVYAFPEGKSGSNPAAGVLIGPGGFLYGVTVYGGGGGDGTIFYLRPPQTAGEEWTETILYSFGSTLGSGWFPRGNLVAGKDGTLYGTTSGGSGTVFRLETPGYWIESAYDFPFAVGYESYGGVVIGPNEQLFGTAFEGGIVSQSCGNLGCGTVFVATPPPSSGGTWSGTMLHTFTGVNGDGANPYAGLAPGPNGVLYGTTVAGGASGFGTIFALTLPPGVRRP